MKKLFLLLSLLAVSILWSCVPDGSQNTTPPPTNGGNEYDWIPKITLKTEKGIIDSQLNAERLKQLNIDKVNVKSIYINYFFINVTASDKKNIILSNGKFNVLDISGFDEFLLHLRDPNGTAIEIDPEGNYVLDFTNPLEPEIDNTIIRRDTNSFWYQWNKRYAREISVPSSVFGTQFNIFNGDTVCLLLYQTLETHRGEYYREPINLSSMCEISYIVNLD